MTWRARDTEDGEQGSKTGGRQKSMTQSGGGQVADSGVVFSYSPDGSPGQRRDEGDSEEHKRVSSGRGKATVSDEKKKSSEELCANDK